METPNTKAGRITEKIMEIFWREEKFQPPVKLETTQYNTVYSHVLRVLMIECPEKP